MIPKQNETVEVGCGPTIEAQSCLREERKRVESEDALLAQED